MWWKALLIVTTFLAAMAAGAAPLRAQTVEGVFQQFPSSEPDPSRPLAGDLLTQPPNRPQFACLYSDPDFVQVLAENFVVGDAPIQIDEIVLRAHYAPGNNPGIDSFNVRFLTNAGGLPGSAVAPQEIDVPHIRVDTGFNWGTFDEYEFTLSLVEPVALGGGTYWVEIYDFTTGTTSSFCWATGMVDPVRGVTGLASSGNIPGETWRPGSLDLNLELNGVVIPVELERFVIE